MPRDAAAPLQRRAEHRVTRVGRDVEDRAEALDGIRVEPFGVDAVEPVGVDPPPSLADIGLVVRQVQDAALAQHDVEIEFGRQPLPQLQRMLVDPRAGVPQIIRADDRRVAPGIAEADRAFFEHRDIADAVLFREIISGRQPVPAAADNHDLVALSRRRLAPSRRPAPVPRQRMPGEREDGILLHRLRLAATTGAANCDVRFPSSRSAGPARAQIPVCCA